MTTLTAQQLTWISGDEDDLTPADIDLFVTHMFRGREPDRASCRGSAGWVGDQYRQCMTDGRGLWIHVTDHEDERPVSDRAGHIPWSQIRAVQNGGVPPEQGALF
jgi:hypothetical protein